MFKNAFLCTTLVYYVRTITGATANPIVSVTNNDAAVLFAETVNIIDIFAPILWKKMVLHTVSIYL